MCEACYRDCLRGVGKPRWVGLSKHLICKHCFICCHGPSDCSCDSLTEWGITQHFGSVSELELWLNYFLCANGSVKTNDSEEYDICRAHYAIMHKIIGSRVCKLCGSNSTLNWVLGKKCT